MKDTQYTYTYTYTRFLERYIYYKAKFISRMLSMVFILIHSNIILSLLLLML